MVMHVRVRDKPSYLLQEGHRIGHGGVRING